MHAAACHVAMWEPNCALQPCPFRSTCPQVIQYRIGGNEFQYENNQLTNVVAASHMAKVLSLTSLNKQLAGQSIRWAATTEQCNTIADGGC